MTRRHRGLWIVPGLFSLFVIWFWYGWPAEPQPDGERWVPIVPQHLQQHLGLAGRLQATRQVTVTAPFDGILAAIAVSHGQRVQAGQVLLTLDTDQLAIQLRQVEADWLRARSNVMVLEAWASGPEVGRARRMLANARSALAAGQVNLSDTQRLYERGIVARMELQGLARQVEAQRQTVLDAEQELQQAQVRGQGDSLQIARMELSNAEARKRALLSLQRQRVIKAPFSAVVVRVTAPGDTAVPLQPGQQVVRGTPLLELIDLDQLQVLAAVEEQDVGILREGQQVQVSVAGQSFTGVLAQISQQPRPDDGQGTWYDVVADLDRSAPSAQSGLRLGMSAQLKVLVYSNDSALVVPAEALRVDQAGAHHAVWRGEDGQPARRVLVKAGVALPEGVEAIGLESGYVQLP
ncbi:secretion protein HlyD family protein [Pseudomonas putida]|nr:secretion protein HlyD family protein [Pseudomonas putida]